MVEALHLPGQHVWNLRFGAATHCAYEEIDTAGKSRGEVKRASKMKGDYNLPSNTRNRGTNSKVAH